MPSQRTIPRVCEQCGKHFLVEPYTARRGHGRFCSRECFRATYQSTEARFWAKVHKGADCWLWTARVNNYGYGIFNLSERKVYAHRLAYTLVYGTIPDGLFVLHRCDNPRCVRPDHLFLGTAEDNMRDCIAKGRHHPLSGERNGHAKLTASQAEEIRRRYVPRKVSLRKLAREFGVSNTVIRRIVTGVGWKPEPQPETTEVHPGIRRAVARARAASDGGEG